MESKRKQDVDQLSCNCGHCREQTSKKIYKDGKFLLKQYAFSIVEILLSCIMFIVALFLPSKMDIIFFVLSALVVGYGLIIEFFKNIIKLNLFNENFLMLVASVTAFVLGEYFEGALIVLLFFIGEFLERVATDNSKRKIAGLSKLKSSVAHLITKDGIYDVSPEKIEIGSLIEIKSGETVAIDGELLGAFAEFDMKSITGESKFYTVKNGEGVYSGAINVGNSVVIKTTKDYKDSTVEKIIEMVEGSLSKKAKSQKFITKFASLYTPIIFIISILIAGIFPLFDQFNFIKWIYKALNFLVISCPCSLVISVPLSFFVGIGGLAKQGILVKGSNYIDSLEKVKTVIFDKTGTLTNGDFFIERIESLGNYKENEILKFVATLEKSSNHPIARSICTQVGNTNLKAQGVQEIKGKGMSGVIDDKKIYVGNQKLARELGVKVGENFAGTILYCLIDGFLQGKIYIIDCIKSNAKLAVQKLKRAGIKNTYILSGDEKIIVDKVCNDVEIDIAYSSLLPSEKVDMLKQIKSLSNGQIMYVGDGINDSPSLATADIGVAMGGLGSEIATSSADIVIMDDNLEKISLSITHSKKIKRIIFQNIFGSLFTKFTIMILSVFTFLPVWLAMFADVGVMFIAVCNSFRASKIK